MRSPVLNNYLIFSFWHSYLAPHPRKPAINYDSWEHYRQASGWYSIDRLDSPVAELIYIPIRLVKNL